MNKIFKILTLFILFLFAIAIVGAAILPTWASSKSGTKTVIKWINQTSKAKISAEKIELHWFGPQRVHQLHYENKKRDLLLTLPYGECKNSLFSLLLGGRTLNKVILDAPSLTYKTKTAEETKKKKPKNASEDKNWSFKELEVKQGSLNFFKNDSPPIHISNIEVKKEDKPQLLIIKAETIQEANKGTIDVLASLENKIEAKILIQDFPTAILDHFYETDLISAGLGPTLRAKLNVEGEQGNSLTINGTLKSSQLNATLSGSTQNNQFALHPESRLDFTITPSFFKQIIDEKSRGDWELASKVGLTVEIEKGIFPLHFKKTYNFKKILLKATAKIQRAELHHSTVGSYSLKQFEATVTSSHNLEISFQGDIKGKETTKLVGNASISPQKHVLFDFVCEGFPTTLLELASERLEKNIKYLFGSQFNLEGQGKYVEGETDAHFDISSPNTTAKVHLTGLLSELSFEATGTRQVRGGKAKILGSSIDFNLNGVSDYTDHNLSIPFIQGNASNPFLEVDLKGKIGEKGEVFSLDRLQLTSTGRIKKLPIEEELSQSALENGHLFIQVDGSKNLITGRAESHSLDTRFEIHNFIKDAEIDFDQADISFSCNLNEFPVSLVSPFISDELDLTTFIGKTITLASKGSYHPHQEPRLSIDVNAQGSGFSTSLAIALDKTLIVRQSRPSFVYWELTPERYEALMHFFRLNPESTPTSTLVRPTTVELNITQFICPTAPSKNLGHFLCQSGFVGDLKIGTTIFRNKATNESLQFQTIVGVIKGENFSKAIDLSLSGHISAENIPRTEKSSFSFEGQMFNFWTPQGKFNREKLTVKGVLSLDLLPVRQLTGIVPLDPETRTVVQAVLGELVNARIYGEISQLAGPITIDMKSSNFKAKLPLTLNKNVFHLREAVDMEITLTEAVNEALLKDVAPLFITGAYSEKPIRVHIEPQGTVIPIKPFSLGNVQIGSAVIDLGRIHVRNGGQIASMMQFLDADMKEGWMEAWFTPIYMTLQNGVASYKRFDALLAGSYHIALWGNINLINGNVNMILGIAPSTLYNRFKISGLSKTELFQVKMRGTTTNLDLDWSGASKRITFIVARNATGPIGAILGGVIEQLVPKLGEEPSPPPTTDPFPWEAK